MSITACQVLYILLSLYNVYYSMSGVVYIALTVECLLQHVGCGIYHLSLYNVYYSMSGMVYIALTV